MQMAINATDRMKAILRFPMKSMLIPGLMNCMNQFLDGGFPLPAKGHMAGAIGCRIKC
jgi:hypothetical protein